MGSTAANATILARTANATILARINIYRQLGSNQGSLSYQIFCVRHLANREHNLNSVINAIAPIVFFFNKSKYNIFDNIKII